MTQLENDVETPIISDDIDQSEKSTEVENSTRRVSEMEPSAIRPEGLPDKFWDSDAGRVRTDALFKSYRELEHRFGGLAAMETPNSHEDYEISVEVPNMTSDPEVNARLHAAGFSQDQAQLVYDMAAEYLGPMAGNLTADMASEMDRNRLVDHFGGAERWQELSAQLRDWGMSKLGDDAFSELSRSYEGVLALHNMMAREEPQISNAGLGVGKPLGEEGLKEMMRDPRYWRDHDPATVQKIKDGFTRLYPDPE